MRYEFADVVLDPARRELRRGGTLVAVEPQVFDLLLLLVRERHRVVSRDDLMQAVWSGRIVSEATLSSRVNAARAAIGDNGAEQRLIRTLPRKGLRFVAEVSETTDAGTFPAPAAGKPVLARMLDHRLPSVAVLAFANMTGDPEQDYFADGMADEIITALSRGSGLLVIARSSSFTYKGCPVDVRRIGQELGAGYVLDGSVRRSGDRLRITGHLIDAVSGAHLWSDRVDGDRGEVFSLQDRVAESVAAAIEPTLQLAEIRRTRDSRPDRLDAYDLLLRAAALEHACTATSLAEALVCLERALAIEPDYTAALAASVYCRAQCHFQGWAVQEATERSATVRLAWRAVERAPNDPQVLWMAAFAIWNMAGEERARAHEVFRRSLLINPNSATALTLAGWIEVMNANLHDGREMLRRAQRLNPRDPRGWAERALTQNARLAVALRVLAVSLVQLGQQERAARAVRELLAIEPGLTISGFLTRIPMPIESMARLYADALRSAGLPE